MKDMETQETNPDDQQSSEAVESPDPPKTSKGGTATGCTYEAENLTNRAVHWYRLRPVCMGLHDTKERTIEAENYAGNRTCRSHLYHLTALAVRS